MFSFPQFSLAWEGVMGKPNKQWGSSECVRGGAGSKQYTGKRPGTLQQANKEGKVLEQMIVEEREQRSPL